MTACSYRGRSPLVTAGRSSPPPNSTGAADTAGVWGTHARTLRGRYTLPYIAQLYLSYPTAAPNGLFVISGPSAA